MHSDQQTTGSPTACEFSRLPANRPEGGFTCPYCGQVWHRPTSGGAVAPEAFERVFRENLSPDGLATIIALLEQAALRRPPLGDLQTRQLAGLRQAEWLANVLTELLGVGEYQRLMEELGL